MPVDDRGGLESSFFGHGAPIQPSAPSGQQSSEGVTALHELGSTAPTPNVATRTPVIEQYAGHLAGARAFHATNGHLRVPPGITLNGIDVYEWMADNRKPGSIARTDTALRQALDAMDPGWTVRHDPGCVQALHAAGIYRTQYGDLRPPPGTLVNGVDVHQSMAAYRNPDGCAQKDRTLRRILTALDSRWEQDLNGYDDGLRAADIYHAQHGHLCPLPGTYIDDVDLYAFLRQLHRWYTNGRLTNWQITQWDVLGIIWRSNDPGYDRGLAACREYRAREGHLNPPRGHYVDRWLVRQNQRYHAGKLTADQVNELTEIGAISPTTPTPAWHARNAGLTGQPRPATVTRSELRRGPSARPRPSDHADPSDQVSAPTRG